MRLALALSALAVVATLALGALVSSGDPVTVMSAAGDGDRAGVEGALSRSAHEVAPERGDARELQEAYRRAHRSASVRALVPRRVLQASHDGVLWALATFTLSDGRVVVERFAWRGRAGWRDLGATRARCPAV